MLSSYFLASDRRLIGVGTTICIFILGLDFSLFYVLSLFPPVFLFKKRLEKHVLLNSLQRDWRDGRMDPQNSLSSGIHDFSIRSYHCRYLYIAPLDLESRFDQLVDFCRDLCARPRISCFVRSRVCS